MRKRNATVVLLVGIMVAGVAWSQVAQAKASQGRTAKGSYATPAVGVAGEIGAGSCNQSNGFGCVELFTRPNEHHVTVSISDMSGQPVYATWGQDSGDPGGYTPSQITIKGSFCGKTTKPLSITGGQRLVVFIYEGPGPDPVCPGVATQGSITATFTK
jgi:hypothetical protein